MGLRELNKRMNMDEMPSNFCNSCILYSSHINITEPALPSMGGKPKGSRLLPLQWKEWGQYYCITSNENENY